MWYIIIFAIGFGIGALVVSLMRKGNEVTLDEIETIVNRTIKAREQNKSTEEIIAEIDALLNL